MSIPNEISQDSMLLIARFVVSMYDRVSEVLTVNEARKQLFTQKSRAIENLPPTKAALVQHVKRACYQAFTRSQAREKSPDLSEPTDWEWTKDATLWQPLWTTLLEAASLCAEPIRCRCKKGCTGWCKCNKAAPKCTALCLCASDCVFINWKLFYHRQNIFFFLHSILLILIINHTFNY